MKPLLQKKTLALVASATAVAITFLVDQIAGTNYLPTVLQLVAPVP